MIRAALLVLALVVLAPAAAAAPGDATRLEYARSAGAARCPDRDALKSAVSERLGYDPFFPAARQTVVVEITDANDGLLGKMSLVDEQGMIIGSRELKENSEHCDELVASLALAISIALDPSAALGEQAAGASSDPSPPSAPAAIQEPEAALEPAASPSQPEPATAPRQRAARASERSGRSLVLPSTARAAAFATRGVAPSTAVGWRVGTTWNWDGFRLLAEFADQFPAARDGGMGGQVKASLYEGTLAPCLARGAFAACALFNLGSFQARGASVQSPVRDSTLYVALGLRAEYEPMLVGPVHLLLSAEALKSLTPITLRLYGEPVWKTPFAALGLGIGLAVRVP